MNVVVGVSDMKISNNPEETLVTYSLGSCIGVVIYDASVKVGGLLHYMLPDSTIDSNKAERNPYMFCDKGIPQLFKESYRRGAKKQNIQVYVFGGAQILDQKGFFNIGKRNYTALRKIFFKNNVVIKYENVGGNVNRTVRLEINSGKVFCKVSGQGERQI